MADLRSLVQQATPGPWYFREPDPEVEEDWTPDVRDQPPGAFPSAIILQGEDCYLPHEEAANLQLAALAPVLAQLIIDMADALVFCKAFVPEPKVIPPLLARFAALGEETT